MLNRSMGVKGEKSSMVLWVEWSCYNMKGASPQSEAKAMTRSYYSEQPMQEVIKIRHTTWLTQNTEIRRAHSQSRLNSE